jgi:Ca2+-transporting ATPase
MTTSIEDLRRSLQSDFEAGLSEEQVGKALTRYGPNVIPRQKESIYRIYIAPLRNLLIDIFIVMSAILTLFALVVPGIWAQVVQWLGVIALNALVAVVQQARSRKKLGALQKLSASKCKVLRAGSMEEIPSEQLVPGDIIRLDRGDRIPADAQLFRSAEMRVNESALTGESRDVRKSETAEAINLARPANKVYLGTFVTAGSGTAIVTGTGKDTDLGRISAKLGSLPVEKLQIRDQINRIAKFLGASVVLFLVISLSYKFLLASQRGELVVANTLPLAAEVVRTLIVAMSIIPQNIPLLTTIILVTGVLAMARHNVVVRDLNSVETFSRVSVVCTDKTGTITKGEMTARWLCLPELNRVYGVTGIGFDTDGSIVETESEMTLDKLRSLPSKEIGRVAVIEPESPLWYILVSGFVNNSSLRVEIAAENAKSTKLLGDLTDVALSVLFGKSGLDEQSCKSRFAEVQTFSFDPKLKRMTRICRDAKLGGDVVFTKGATEVLVPLCSSTVTESASEKTPLDDATRAKILDWANLLAARGYRVISLSYKRTPASGGSIARRQDTESGLIYLGFVALLDPPRIGIRESVIEARNAGVKTVMITGDSAETARSVAEEVGISESPDETVMTASDLQSSSDEEFLRASVFARVSPEDKLLIVKRYQKLGHPVSMTGDGVNDALAISASDVGVAMGLGGTDVAKQAADIVLADDSFNSIVIGIREGRGVFQKIRSIILFYLAVNAAEALVYFGSAFIPRFSLLSSWQHIFIFMTAHTLPPFAIIADHLNRKVMNERPKKKEGVLTKRLFVALLLFSLSLAGFLCFAYFGVLAGAVAPVTAENKLGFIPNFNPTPFLSPPSWEQAKARTMLIAIALISESLFVISLRRINRTIPQMLKEDRSWRAWPLIALPASILLVMVYFPPIQTWLFNSFRMDFELVRLSLSDWGLVALLALIPVVFVELYKVYLQRRNQEL